MPHVYAFETFFVTTEAELPPEVEFKEQFDITPEQAELIEQGAILEVVDEELVIE